MTDACVASKDGVCVAPYDVLKTPYLIQRIVSIVGIKPRKAGSGKPRKLEYKSWSDGVLWECTRDTGV